MFGLTFFAAALACSGVSDYQCGRWATVSNQVLVVDSTGAGHDFSWHRYALESRDGSFVPGHRYEVRFRAKVEGGAKNSFLYTLIRPAAEPSDRLDAGRLAIHPTNGEWKDVSLQVEDVERTDLRLQIHGYNRLRAEVADIRIVERPPLTFVPATAVCTNGIVSVTPSFTPTGAQEFDVEMPRATGGCVLEAADFGVAESNPDNLPALKAALAAAKERKAARLVLKKGVYRLTTNEALTLEGLSDFTFDGGDSTFISHRRSAAFMYVNECTRVRVANFKVDWDWAREPLASLVRVVAVQKDSYDLEFVDYPDFPCKESHLVILSAFDPKTRSVGLEDGITRAIDFRRTNKPDAYRTWLAPNRVRV